MARFNTRVWGKRHRQRGISFNKKKEERALQVGLPNVCTELKNTSPVSIITWIRRIRHGSRSKLLKPQGKGYLDPGPTAVSASNYEGYFGAPCRVVPPPEFHFGWSLGEILAHYWDIQTKSARFDRGIGGCGAGSKGQQPGNAAIMIANGAAPTGSPGYGPLEIPLFDLCASSDAFRKRISRLRAVSVMERLESHLDSVWARLIERAGRLRDTTSRWRTYWYLGWQSKHYYYCSRTLHETV
ncbi:hypothetical protein BDDG_09712 [Blastomyces dermatitidis ATCC 18188]|uniref:Uncharacterized protein n=1 Tax=Ajellomyces dermatitidis (strain ATCC 18188 / CBS 674.68) TaxID=653446 RepID=F2TU49_AJEDA|nr:hypothetical protein BDDG_09712 [Blastomyces dermatitidis ATCC 18188]EQL32781.1 hypothetical protein BDFG_05038 [Blastomyces dermatitidis ATCC 26199]